MLRNPVGDFFLNFDLCISFTKILLAKRPCLKKVNTFYCCRKKLVPKQSYAISLWFYVFLYLMLSSITLIIYFKKRNIFSTESESRSIRDNVLKTTGGIIIKYSWVSRRVFFLGVSLRSFRLSGYFRFSIEICGVGREYLGYLGVFNLSVVSEQPLLELPLLYFLGKCLSVNV